MNTWEYYRDFSKKIGDTVKIVGLGKDTKKFFLVRARFFILFFETLV